jgi:hypothetical protein
MDVIRVVGLVAMATVLTYAAPCRAAETPADSTAARAEVLDLLHATGADSLGLQMSSYMAGAMLDQMRKNGVTISDTDAEWIQVALRKFMSRELPVLLEKEATIYSRHYSREEIRALSAFYQSPLGRKVAHEMPLVLKEAMAVGQTWAIELEPEMDKIMREGFAPKPGDGR